MGITENEIRILQAVNDESFATIAQLAEKLGFTYPMCRYFFRKLNLAGLLEGFKVTYAGTKVLKGEPLLRSDEYSYTDIRLQKANAHRPQDVGD